MALDEYKVAPWLPVGECGKAKIRRFTVDPMGSAIGLFNYGGRTPPPGEYTRLSVGGSLMMSDTPSEIMDHQALFRRAKGRILVAGLGLGMASAALLRKGKVEHMHIIEISPDVIKLVAPALAEHFGSDKISIEQADIFKRKPKKDERYDFCWFDVWGDVSTDVLPEMATLHRRWTRRCDGNYLTWWHDRLTAMKRRERANGGFWPI